VLAVRDLEQRGLSAVDDLLGVAGELQSLALDPACRIEQAPDQGMVLDDPGVVARMRRGGDDRRERVDEGLAANRIQLAGTSELLADGQCVDRLGRRLLLEPHHRGEDHLVPVEVEVGRRQPDLDQDPVERRVPDDDRAEDRGLGFGVVGR
jgi:hypothetical protein